jgi:hypothetical protein
MARANVSGVVKKQVTDLAQGCCEYCKSQIRFSPNSFEIDHIIPMSRGGMNQLENLALACPQCNGHKSDKIKAVDSVSEQIVPLFHPRQMDWKEHFCWSDDTLQMIETTAIGRATVALLQTNRETVVNLRAVLRELGLHPPN